MPELNTMHKLLENISEQVQQTFHYVKKIHQNYEMGAFDEDEDEDEDEEDGSDDEGYDDSFDDDYEEDNNEDDYSEEEDDEEAFMPTFNQSLHPLFQAMDSLFHLLNELERGKQKILKGVPEKKGFWRLRKPRWRTDLQDFWDGYAEGINVVRQKLIATLADMGVHLINPLPGDHFDPVFCRAVETLKGGQSGCIARLIRYGFRNQSSVLRFADVSIYQ